jgi:hypothetical protein
MYHFDIVLKEPVTQIVGASATGKTLFFKTYKAAHSDKVLLFNYNHYDMRNKIIDVIKESSAEYVFIDNGDILMTDALDEYLLYQTEKFVIIAARGTYLCTNGFLGLCSMVRDKNNVFRLDYTLKV